MFDFINWVLHLPVGRVVTMYSDLNRKYFASCGKIEWWLGKYCELILGPSIDHDLHLIILKHYLMGHSALNFAFSMSYPISPNSQCRKSKKKLELYTLNVNKLCILWVVPSEYNTKRTTKIKLRTKFWTVYCGITVYYYLLLVISQFIHRGAFKIMW